VEQKVVLHFDFNGKEKLFPLNVTNFDSMIDVTGKSDSDEWAGCKIELYPTQTPMRGEIVDCIRIRKPHAGEETKKKKSKPPPKPEPESPPEIGDEIPF
jgi:hypothetical protein